MLTPAAGSSLPNDHWVSRGYQANFASDDKRVAVIDARTGRIVDPARPIKSNFREQGFTTYLDAGVPNDLLERAFASVERSVLNQVREVGPSRAGPVHKAAVANLFAIHLVRSPSFKDFHRAIGDQFRSVDVPAYATSPELHAKFEEYEGRRPVEGELLELAARTYESFDGDPTTLATSMLRQHDKQAEMLNRFHMQVLTLEPNLPGFVIGDTPVVHASLVQGRYGFRDRLALGDADLIIGPLTRRTAACFTASRLASAAIKTRRMIDTINAILIRAASAEVACHPDDLVKVRQTQTRLDRLPPQALNLGGSRLARSVA